MPPCERGGSGESDAIRLARAAASSDGSEARVAPVGRDARLWRVLVELSFAAAAFRADASGTAEASTPPPPRPKPFAAGVLERLVVEFDDAYTIFVEGMDRLPSEAQLLALQAVDRQLVAMVRAQDAELWTQKGLREDPRWGEAHLLVVGAIEAFAWPTQRLSLVVPAAVSEGQGAGESSGASGGPRSRP